MIRSDVTLEDKYTTASGRIYLNGLQALVRIPIMQRLLDQRAGLNTATFISGYRGSPLGALDMALTSAKSHLEAHDIKFTPGINEDLGATAVWGSQQLNLGPKAKYDGIVGIWYGKGPGVDRSLDALKHANAAGSSKHGGVLALAGDDHACKSSTFPHQSEQAFLHAMIPVLHPAGIDDALMLGLHGIAMSRYSGCWSGFKITSDFADSSASVFSDPFALDFKMPEDFEMPQDGLNIRWYDPPVEQEKRLINLKLPAAQAYARANGLDRYTLNPAKKRLTIVTTGKAWMDTMQTLTDLGITNKRAEELGLAVYKIALTWPLEREGIIKIADETNELLVIEEKRGFIEDQIKQILFNIPTNHRPHVVGKTDENGAPLLPENYELWPALIGGVLMKRLKGLSDVSDIEMKLATLGHNLALKGQPAPVVRMPWYCSGCPHNSSTVVPEGSRALAGIGCHYMAMWMDRKTEMFTQMGGEGVPWIGQAPFTDEEHIFVNLGDGTYFHSGILAIRAAVAAKVNITYKILYNDAVAMTGGQHVDGELTVEALAKQVAAEGVRGIIVMSDAPEKYSNQSDFPTGTRVEHRDDIDLVQKELRQRKGVSVLIYDQTCAAEKRRRRKRGLMEDPAIRVMINERVCEGCGDCGAQSNCLSIAPVETEFGKKRQIDQSSCNKDFSCVKGFCPSFITVRGGDLKKPEAAAISPETDTHFSAMPDPVLPTLDHAKAILVTGVGGTGIVTIGAIMAMAAHLEDKGCSTMDQTGLAQKGGAVTSHVRIAASPKEIHTVRLETSSADLILGCDMLVTADGESLSKIRKGDTKIVLNMHETQTGEFTHNPEWKIPAKNIALVIGNQCGSDNLFTLDATDIATALLGNSIATNMFMLGYAWQKGLIPLSQESIFKALELNAVAVKMNQKAFIWGRRAAWDMKKVAKLAAPKDTGDGEARHREVSTTIGEMVQRRVLSLTNYQSPTYARVYEDLVKKARKADTALHGKEGDLTAAVSKYYYKLMAYKDEYEVARLYTDGQFMNQVKKTFDGNYKVSFNLAPPLLARRDHEGHLRKMEFGPWIFTAFKVLARLKFLRGTPLDIFGYTKERRTERGLIASYRTTIEDLLPHLTKDNYKTALALATLPEDIRGYGHVKEAHLEKALAKEKELLQAFYAADEEKKAA
ncbi:MAG: indolepyruvate ferredoxin oxidoreductase family protein [Alphaproteobacteria bacterium]|nr:indolepyruvate ferredoxin oxidoreductase family protein [Alphaproteobacteria bacterium]